MDKNEAVVRVFNNKREMTTSLGPQDPWKDWVVIPKMLSSLHFMASVPQSRHQYRYLLVLKTNSAKYRSTSVSECNFDKPAYFFAIGFIRFSKKV